MRIKRVRMYLEAPDVTAVDPAANALVNFILRGGLSTRQGQTFVPNIEQPGCIAFHERTTMIHTFGGVAAPSANGVAMATVGEAVVEYDYGEEGVLVADSTLSIYIQQVNETVLGAAPAAADSPKRCNVEIEYELVRLSDAEFIGALSLFETL